jgi:hypothetical protein
MDFDIHRLDAVDPTSNQAWGALGRYQEALLQRFYDSPEAEELVRTGFGIGYWAAQMIHFGFSYLGATIPCLTEADAKEILAELFPRKISLSAPDEADAVIPELLAFWRYLEREYRLPNAPAIMSVLRELQPQFRGLMNDPSKFGLAKSFCMAGKAAGFDMHNEEQLKKFALLYNAGLAAEDEARSAGHPGARRTSSSRKQRNRIRKLSSRTRKRNRKKGR